MHLVDASVWAALVDPGDRYHGAANDFLRDPARSVSCLDLTLYEIANAVGVKMGRGREARALLRAVAVRCQGDPVEVDAETIELALELAAEHGLTAYDAAYVAAARRRGMTLVSTDLADLVSKGLAVTPGDAGYP